MPTAWSFRLTIYLTLALSCACLGYSEWDYLPEVTYFTGVVILAMVVAFIMDARNVHLSLTQANFAGAGIFLLAGVWIFRNYRQPDSLMHTLPWPAGGLPFLAPLLMLLVPAELFRPKRTGDWWGLYGISLASVGLAMSMAEDGLFGLLVALYAVAAVWSLALFYLRRASGYRKVELREATPIRSHLPKALLWMALAGLFAAPIFFLTPRTTGVPWELFQAKMESGLSPDGSPDLSRTGTLKPNPEPALEVTATRRDGSPKLDLPLDQRFFVAAYTEYQTPRGRWARPGGPPIIDQPAATAWQPSPTLETPDFGPDTFHLDFRAIIRLPAPAFADPVSFHRTGRPPLAVPMRSGYGYAMQIWDASFVFPQRQARSVNRWLQTCRGRMPDGGEPVSHFSMPEGFHPQQLLGPYLTPPPPRVADYARTLLRRLIESGRLPDSVRARMGRTVYAHFDDHAVVAEAFRQHLSADGGFTYSLELRRQNKSIDPVEDFLDNTRSGHCERFATALVLMLRGVGIPSQFSTGYRGCKSLDDGRYMVLQSDAHAWAGVLLSQVAADGRREWRWQAFDPTPASDTGDTSTGLIDIATGDTGRLFSQYIIGLNPDSQARLTKQLSDFLDNNWPALAAAPFAIVALIYALRFLINRFRGSAAVAPEADPVPWYTRLTAILRNTGLPDQPGETPREFSRRAVAWLKTQPAAVSDDVIPRAAAALYRNRYAGQPLDPDEITQLESDIDQFARTLPS